MVCACIDIGSNTTRLLVATLVDGRLEEVLAERAFTRIGSALTPEGRIAPGKIAEVGQVVAGQVERARDRGAQHVRAVATAAIRHARNGGHFARAVEAASGVPVEILTEQQEARYAFLGATRTLEHRPRGDIGVVDVGGSSTELVIGTLADGVRWLASFRLGSGDLADAYLRSDPPSRRELEQLRAHIAGVLEELEIPHPDHAVAVGGSATSLRRLVGPHLDPRTLSAALEELSTLPVAEAAQRFEIAPERIRLLPAGLLILAESGRRLACPLELACGGLREGVLLERLGVE